MRKGEYSQKFLYLTDPANPVKEALFFYDNMTDIVSFGVTRYFR